MNLKTDEEIKEALESVDIAGYTPAVVFQCEDDDCTVSHITHYTKDYPALLEEIYTERWTRKRKKDIDYFYCPACSENIDFEV